MDEIRGTGAALWAIANDDVDKLRDFHAEEGLGFPILLDADAEVIRDWGILNEQDARGRLIPHPTVVMLDADGVVRWVHTDTNYRVRPPTEELVERLREITGD